MSPTGLSKIPGKKGDPKHKLFGSFGLVPKSPTHTGLICVKPRSRISYAWAPFRPSPPCTLDVRYT